MNEKIKCLEEAAKQFVGYDMDTDYLRDYEVGIQAFIEGAEWQKRQMLEDAVERVVKVDAGGYPYIDATELYDYEKDKPLAKAGDKVKIIIVKEE